MTVASDTGADGVRIGNDNGVDEHAEHSEFYKHVIACIKALSNDITLSISVGAEAPADQSDINLPLIDNESNKSLTALVRGLGDSFAMMHLHHDPKLHNRIAPNDPVADRLFTLLERERFESVGASQFKGVAHNLESVWALSHGADALARFGPAEQLEFVLCCLCRAQLSGRDLPIAAQRFIEPIRGPVEDLLGDSFLALAQHTEHQSRFAEHALIIIERLGFDIAPKIADQISTDAARNNAGNGPEDESQDTEDASADERSEEQTTETDTDTETMPGVDDKVALPEQVELVRNPENASNKDEELENPDENAIVETDVLTRLWYKKLAASHYRVYDKTDDQICKAASLINKSELKVLRKELDVYVQHYKPLVGQLAARLQQLLLSKQKRAWQQDLDEGVLDPHRLTRFIVNPLAPLTYRRQSEYPVRDTAVCLLIDNSRSMLGKPIATAACCADLITRVLERCGVSCEVLGYTTVTMYGGAVIDRWQSQGRPRDVGRLNNVRHVIYKSVSDSWQRSRDNFGLMLNRELLKQNIDGEALMWARQRLLNRPEKRRIMIVISDGRPSDSYTLKANHKQYLRDHLDHVIAQIEHRSDIELVAIGIGHQVSHHYRRSFNLDDVEQLGPLLLSELSRLLHG